MICECQDRVSSLWTCKPSHSKLGALPAHRSLEIHNVLDGNIQEEPEPLTVHCDSFVSSDTLLIQLVSKQRQRVHSPQGVLAQSHGSSQLCWGRAE